MNHWRMYRGVMAWGFVIGFVGAVEGCRVVSVGNAVQKKVAVLECANLDPTDCRILLVNADTGEILFNSDDLIAPDDLPPGQIETISAQVITNAQGQKSTVIHFTLVGETEPRLITFGGDPPFENFTTIDWGSGATTLDGVLVYQDTTVGVGTDIRSTFVASKVGAPAATKYVAVLFTRVVNPFQRTFTPLTAGGGGRSVTGLRAKDVNTLAYSQDDGAGVERVRYKINGGPLSNGSTHAPGGSARFRGATRDFTHLVHIQDDKVKVHQATPLVQTFEILSRAGFTYLDCAFRDADHSNNNRLLCIERKIADGSTRVVVVNYPKAINQATPLVLVEPIGPNDPDVTEFSTPGAGNVFVDLSVPY